MISPENEYEEFETKEEVLEFMKECGAEGKDRVNPREKYVYKGLYSEEYLDCEVVGHEENHTAVIQFENGDLHCIHPIYLGEMQSSNFVPIHEQL